MCKIDIRAYIEAKHCAGHTEHAPTYSTVGNISDRPNITHAKISKLSGVLTQEGLDTDSGLRQKDVTNYRKKNLSCLTQC